VDDKIIDNFRKILLEVPRRIMNENGRILEIYGQPERSKREDSEYGGKCDFGLWKSEMRCSEHSGN